MSETNASTEALDRLIPLLETHGEVIVTEYIKWHIYSSLTWIVIACVFLAISWKSVRIYEFIEDEDIQAFFTLLTKVCAGLAGIIMIGTNVPDLLAPTGMSIHQLIKDILG